MSPPGVTEASVYPLRRGYGTLDMLMVTHNDMSSPETIKAVQIYIDEMRTAHRERRPGTGPRDSQKRYHGPQVSLRANWTLDAARKQIRNALTDHFNRLAQGAVAGDYAQMLSALPPPKNHALSG